MTAAEQDRLDLLIEVSRLALDLALLERREGGSIEIDATRLRIDRVQRRVLEQVRVLRHGAVH